MLIINARIRIPLSELEWTFARSSGPGGQNVNKVNTKATMHWDPAASVGLPADVRDRFLAKYAGRIAKDGRLVLSSQRFRDQARNIDDCLQRLKAMVEVVVNPPKQRRPTKPTRGSKERRLKQKKQRSQRKDSRRGVDW